MLELYPLLLTQKDMVEILRETPQTIQRQWHNDEIPKPIRIGRRGLRWRRHEVEEFLNKAAAEPVGKVTQ